VKRPTLIEWARGKGAESPRRPRPLQTPPNGNADHGRDDDEAARARLTITLNSLLDPYVMLRAVRDASGLIIDVEYADANSAALSYIGRTRDNLIGSRLLQDYPTHATTGLFAEYAHVIETGDPLVLNDVSLPSEIKHERRYFDMRGVRVDDGVSVTWRDVTDRHELIDHFRLLAENASDIVIQAAPDGTITWVSPSVTHELGWHPDEVVGRFLGGVTRPDVGADRDQWIALLDERGHATFETETMDRDGTYHHYAVTARNITNDAGVVTSRVASLRNIDREVAQREDLRTERDILNATLQATLDPHIMLRAIRAEDGHVVDFKYTEANESACVYNRMSRDELIGRRLLDLLPGHVVTGLFDDFVHAVETGEPLVLNDLVYRNELTGTLTHSDVRAVRVGDLLSFTWHDITSRVEAGERYRLLAENSSDVILVADMNFRYEWVSRSITTVLGWQPDDLVGHTAWEFVHPEDQERVRAASLDELDGRYGVDDVRFRTSDGAYLHCSSRTRVAYDDTGQPVARIAALRDTEAEFLAKEALRASEEQFKLLAENASDIVCRLSLQSEIEWISPSVYDVLGRRPEELVGMKGYDLVADEDRRLLVEPRQAVLAGGAVDVARVRFARADGEVLWMGLRAHPLIDSSGVVRGMVVAARDRQAEILAERASTMLSAGSQAMVRAESEQQLLDDMCRIAEEEAGYAFAWYGRKIHDERHSVASIASSESNRTYLDEITVTWGEEPHGMGPTGRAIRTGETVLTRDFRADVRFSPWLEAALRHGFRSSLVLPVRIGDEIDGSIQVYAHDPDAFDESSVRLMENLAAEIGYGLKRLRDRDDLAHTRVGLERALADQALLVSAMDQTRDSVIIADLESTILYANPAASATSGYPLEELVGGTPRIFQSGQHPASFYDEMWRVLSADRAWHGVIWNKRKSGELYEEDVSISPVHDDQGRRIAYVAVKHDLTSERQLEKDRTREQADRAAIIEIMRRTSGAPGEIDLVVAAERFCKSLTNLSDIDIALVLVNGPGGMVPIAVSGTDLGDIAGDAPILPDRAEMLFQVSEGPTKISLRPEDWPINAGLIAEAVQLGVEAIVLVPIRAQGEMVGVLGLATKSAHAATLVESRYPYFDELGAYAGSAFGDKLRDFQVHAEERAAIRRIIDERTFRIVFQPIVDLRTNATLGFEALSRFTDAVPPDRVLDNAERFGLRGELESLCAAAAFEAARALPPDAFLNVNFSPAAITDGWARGAIDTARRAGLDRPITFEITEHAEIDDYPALRRAVADCEGCRVAVDDAISGYANIRHIVQLQPDVVKIDIFVVRDIDQDPARQAMAAALCHYAAQSGTAIIAEGVETPEEAATLLEIGAALGEHQLLAQGYLFGRPEAIGESGGVS
jgi:PAS domain S-box-containing protein